VAKYILGATFALAEDDPQRILTKVKEIWMYKKNSQPLADKSAGCVFKNPRGLSAGALIDQSGLKGTAVGGAEVSTKHANFITARKGATAADVQGLIELIRERVREKFDVKLETEVVIW
jgi:UDP-N-acetylmuramate dehydrogenase